MQKLTPAGLVYKDPNSPVVFNPAEVIKVELIHGEEAVEALYETVLKERRLRAQAEMAGYENASKKMIQDALDGLE